MGTPALHFLEVILTVSHFNLDLGPQPPNLVGTCFKPPVLCGPGLGSAEVSSPGDQAFVKENTGTFFFFFPQGFLFFPSLPESEGFSAFHSGTLVGFLEVKPMKLCNSPNTEAPLSFLLLS